MARSISAGGQDLEQHLNGEIKRIATVTPTASIANTGDGLERLGAKIGDIGMKLEKRRRAMNADRWQTDLQIKTNNVMSNPEVIRAMQKGDFDTARTHLQEVFNEMNSKMETDYGITDKMTQFELGKVNDTIYGNMYSALNIKQVAWEDNYQKEEYTKLMDEKINLLIANMNSGDDVTANANYLSALKSLEGAYEDKLINADQHQAYLRKFRRTRVTGVAERMVEDAYNRGDIKELNRLAVELDHSDYLHRLGGNGDERLGSLVTPYLNQYNRNSKINMLNGNIRDDAEFATTMAGKTGDEDWTKISNAQNNRRKNFMADPWLMAADAGNITLENSGTHQNYVSDNMVNIVRQTVGEKVFNENFKDMNINQAVEFLDTVYSDSEKRITMFDAIDFSRDTTLGIDKDIWGRPDSVSLLKEEIETKYAGLPYKVRNKMLMDIAKTQGYSQLDVFNNLNQTPNNKYGGSIEQMKSYMKDIPTAQGTINEYKIEKERRLKEDKGFKENEWESYGFFGGISKRYNKIYEYLNTLEGNDPRKIACLEAVKRCNALYVKTMDKDLVREAYQQQIDNIMGGDEVVDMNGKIFAINKDFVDLIPAIKEKAKKVLSSGDAYYGSTKLKDLSKTSNLSNNVYVEPISDTKFKVSHKAFPNINDEQGGIIVIDVRDIVEEKERTKLEFTNLGNQAYIEITGGK